MSATLCVAMKAPAAAAAARHGPRADVRPDGHSTDDAATTGDSDSDSAFESDAEPTGGIVVEARGTPALESREELARDWQTEKGNPLQQQRQRKQPVEQPLPRRVRFKIHHTKSSGDVAGSSWNGKQRAAYQESALLSLGMLAPGQSAGVAQRQQSRRQQSAAFGRAMGSRPRVAAPTPAAPGTPQRAAGITRKKCVAAPLKDSSSKNNSRWPSFTGARKRLGSENAFLSPANSPKKHAASATAPVLQLRAPRAVRIGVISTSACRIPASKGGPRRLSRLTSATAFTTPAPVSKSRGTLAVADARATPAFVRPEAKREPDLSCEEVFDVDAVMKPAGEVRMPICRMRVPSWPEGVEGYEEVGGWRRLGGPTRETFPQGRRCG